MNNSRKSVKKAGISTLGDYLGRPANAMFSVLEQGADSIKKLESNPYYFYEAPRNLYDSYVNAIKRRKGYENKTFANVVNKVKPNSVKKDGYIDKTAGLLLDPVNIVPFAGAFKKINPALTALQAKTLGFTIPQTAQQTYQVE